MLRGLYTGASGMLARQVQMDVVANNLSNVNTAGYKQDDVVFREFPQYLQLRLKDEIFLTTTGSVDLRPTVGKLGTGVTVDAIATNYNQGPLQPTENRFDLALYGKGFFEVETRGGNRYTRDGSFVKDADGFLTTDEGFKVIGTDNKPVKVGNIPFIVNEYGEIFEYNAQAPGSKLGQIKIANFEDPEGLRKAGQNLYYATDKAGKISQVNGNNVIIRQGYIEQSNVNAVESMARMIEVNRAYEANSKVIRSHDDALANIMKIGNR